MHYDVSEGDWGGAPMIDLQKGFEYALKAYPEIDKDRTACAGASYGGFAVNYIQGNQEHFGFNFKVLITHDGVCSPSLALFFWCWP